MDLLDVTFAIVGLAAGGVAAYGLWRFCRSFAAHPLINDISTDLENPPSFVATLPLRAAAWAVTADHPGENAARRQREAYPDIEPVETPRQPADAFELALATAEAMPGWRLVACSQPEGRIEASQSSYWLGFVDDVVIRVTPAGSGSRVDVRSHSRHGVGDFGVNAARVRAYLAALKGRLGAPNGNEHPGETLCG
jgi:uncharacterized protein (DUF1499 family)